MDSNRNPAVNMVNIQAGTVHVMWGRILVLGMVAFPIPLIWSMYSLGPYPTLLTMATGMYYAFAIPAMIGLFLLMSLITLLYAVLIYAIYPLGIVVISLLAVAGLIASSALIALAICAVGLIGCGVHSCPTEASFKPWFESFMKNLAALDDNKSSKPLSKPSSNEQSNVAAQRRYSWSGATSYVYSTVASMSEKTVEQYVKAGLIKAIILNSSPKYFHLGAFRLAVCNDIGTDTKPMIFVGVFNTWVPYPY